MKPNWSTKKLGDREYFEILGSGIDKFEGEKSYLSTSSIEKNIIKTPEGKITYQERPSRANMQPRLNSVWFARMKDTIKVYSFTEKNKDEISRYILSTGFAGILCNTNKVLPKYVEKIFLSKWFNSLKDALASDKAIQKSLNNEDIINIEIPLPPLSEQQKIVYILDNIQNMIRVQEKIIEKTKELKKSLLNEIFNSKVKSQKSKFKIQKLLNIAAVKYGKAKPKEESGDIPVIGSGGVYGYTNKALIHQPTIIIGRKGTAGMIYLMMKPCWPSDTTFYLEIDFKRVDPRYLYEFMKTKVISGEEAKTTLPSLKREVLENIEIKILPLPEQREIAEILQTIDQKIEIDQKKKALYEELFKTMLNKLMTGEIKVDNLKI